MEMSERYLWDDGFGTEVADWATNVADQSKLANAIVASTYSLVIDIWSLSNWNNGPTGSACYVEGTTNVVCPTTFSDWEADPETQGWIEMSESGDGDGVLERWDGQIFDEQIKKSFELQVLETLIGKGVGKLPNPANTLVSEILTYAESKIPFQPTTPITANPPGSGLSNASSATPNLTLATGPYVIAALVSPNNIGGPGC
jgi:hypothetical protein